MTLPTDPPATYALDQPQIIDPDDAPTRLGNQEIIFDVRGATPPTKR